MAKVMHPGNEKEGSNRISPDGPSGSLNVAAEEKQPFPPSSTLFEVSEIVLAKFGDLLYDAKVIMVDIPDPNLVDRTIYIKIHYLGWSKARDEWVTPDVLLKRTSENLKKAKELNQAASTTGHRNVKTKHPAKPATTPRNISSTRKIMGPPPPSSKTQSRDRSPEMIIDIPNKLKQFLVDEARIITQTETTSMARFPVPCSRSINSILNDYVKMDFQSENEKEDAVEICLGVREYFNAVVKEKLLFRIEHVQLQQLEGKYKYEGHGMPDLSSVFGGSHLVRFFVMLGTTAILAKSFGVENVPCLLEQFAAFLRFLQANFDKYFVLNCDDIEIDDKTAAVDVVMSTN